MQRGVFNNGIPYLKHGDGPGTLLFLVGGPGAILPEGWAATGFLKGIRPYLANFTVYLAGRKSGLPVGYTTRQMADDYAEVLREDFGGKIDLVIGLSYGGLILQHLAANHQEMIRRIVIAGAAHVVSDEGKELDLKYAQLMVQGKVRAAMAVRAGAVVGKGPGRYLLGGFLFLLGKQLLGKCTAVQMRDLQIEVDAELLHNSRDCLDRIRDPVLVLYGRRDFAFRPKDVREMAGLIKGSRLVELNCGHGTLFLAKEFSKQVLDFVRNESE